MSNIKISVIVPVYNVEKYLHQCIDSILAQTLKDIEIICINDGSTDSSLEILKEYAKIDNRIIIINKENQGQGIARNLGISKAKGEYISFIDPDDWIELNMFEKMYNQAIKLNSEIVICDFTKFIECNQTKIYPDFFSIAKNLKEGQKIDIKTGENINKNLIDKTLLVSPCYSVNRIYKTSLLQKNNIQFAPIRCYEDCIFILKSHILAKNISYISERFYIYRIRNTSTLRQYDDRYIDGFTTIKDLREFLKEYPNHNVSIDYFAIQNIFWMYINHTKEYRKKVLYLAKENLSKEHYKILVQKIKKYNKKNSIIHLILKNLFSIKNSPSKQHKVITILGIKIKFKRKKH